VSEGKEEEEKEKEFPPSMMFRCAPHVHFFIYLREKKRKEEMVATFSLELFKSPKVCRPVCTSK